MEFVPPRRKALSEQELNRALESSNFESTTRASELLREQELLRLEDVENLRNWIADLRQDGSPDAIWALSRFVNGIFPQEIKVAKAIAPPLLTSEFSAISLKRARKRGHNSFSFYLQSIVTGIVVALLNLFVINWLAQSLLDAVIAIGVGVIIAHLLALVLKTHHLHPLLRSAAVFGGSGVYWAAVLLLGAIAIIYSSVYLGASEVFAEQLQFRDFRLDLLLVGLIILLFTQVSSRRIRKLIPVTLVILGLGWLVLNAKFSFPALELSVTTGALWGAIWVAVTTTAVVVYGQPHQKESPQTLGFSALVSIVFSILALGFLGESSQPGWSFIELITCFGLLAMLALSGLDLAGGVLGRLTGAAFIFGIALANLSSVLVAPMLSLLSCAVVLLLLDQLARRSGLHLSSLNTSHGIYGSFQFWSWLALAISTATGFEQVQLLWSSNPGFTSLELALMSGTSLGILFGLIRIPVVRIQDREIKNIEVSHPGSENLIGL